MSAVSVHSHEPQGCALIVTGRTKRLLMYYSSLESRRHCYRHGMHYGCTGCDRQICRAQYHKFTGVWTQQRQRRPFCKWSIGYTGLGRSD
eukprot:803877-Pleurochrysis_carterae.AAC.1